MHTSKKKNYGNFLLVTQPTSANYLYKLSKPDTESLTISHLEKKSGKMNRKYRTRKREESFKP